MKKRVRQTQPKELISAALEILPAGDLRASITLSHNIGEGVTDLLKSKAGSTFLQSVFTGIQGGLYSRIADDKKAPTSTGARP